MKRFHVIIFLAGFLPSCKSEIGDPGNTLFELLPGKETGILFNNVVQDSDSVNILNFRNFYNGGGVGIGDINNDGKPDVLLTSNQGSNKLYLNLGNWKFRDITEQAGVGGINKWHTGVNMIDVNDDGWMDIYICNSGDVQGNFRRNELYINQHDNSFRESASAYGLDDDGIGTQAAFFDVDLDGDLDCFILNNSFRPIESFGYDRNIRNIRSKAGGHRLLRNDAGHFIDISEQAGIFGSEIAFGLGVSVGDLNNDGWPDLYISNDFFERDYLYVNQQNGTFRESITSSTGHTSLASMGSDILDVNNDGLLDVFTTDMLPEDDYRLKTTSRFDDYDVQSAKLQNDFHHQLQANCLQLNSGDGSFKEIASYAGVEATDWSWGALGFDFDNDGWQDIYVCNGISKDLTNQDFLDFYSGAEARKDAATKGFSYRNFLAKLKSSPVSNYAFVNGRDLRFKNRSKDLGLAAPSFSNGAAYGDLDGDGDLDLVVNNENLEAFVYRNNSRESNRNNYLQLTFKGVAGNRFGIGVRVQLFAGGTVQTKENITSRGFQSSVEPVLTFGLDTVSVVDSLLIQWPGGRRETLYNIKANQRLSLDQLNAPFIKGPGVQEKRSDSARLFIPFNQLITGNVVHREDGFVDFDRERLIPRMISAEGPRLAVGDVNADGLDDFFMGNAPGDTARLFVQTPTGSFQQITSFAFSQDQLAETTGACFFDADGDQDLDLVAASGGNNLIPGDLQGLVRLYLNDGAGHFTRAFKGWPSISMNASCVTPADLDGDGRTDLFIGGRSVPGQYGAAPGSVFIRNLGHGAFADVTAELAPDLNHLGMVTEARFARMDRSGVATLIVAGDWMPVTFVKFSKGRLIRTGEINGSSGWWNRVEVNDFDGDGLLDILALNQGQNSKIRADEGHPARLFVSDFDGNGQAECIPVYYKGDGKSYPFNLRGDLVAQLPVLKKKFLRYADYAGKTIDEILTATQIREASVLEVTELRSVIYLNRGQLRFDVSPLPPEAQLTSLYAAAVLDLNGDGRPDVVAGGNLFGLKPETGRYDASDGLVFLNMGGQKWQYVPNSRSGFISKGQIRDLRSISNGGGTTLLVARNNDSLQLFTVRP